MNWRKHKITFEDVMLTIVLVALAVVLLYWLAGCTSVMHKSATLRYKSSQNCEWRLTGLEAIRAEEIGTELEVGEDCTLSRKADAATEKKPPPQ